MKGIESYHMSALYEQLIAKVRQSAPSGLSEAFGVVEFEGIPDFRLSLGKYRVIELAPMAKRIGVFMEWRKLFRNPEVYSDNPDFHSFEPKKSS